MGTRSKTSFIEKIGDKRKHLVSVYQQYDGYIEGVGHEIANYILSKKIINGISLEQTMEKGYCNGFSCLIAQFIKDFKTDIGYLYIVNEEDTQEYNYNIIFDRDLYFSGVDIRKELTTNDFFEVEVIDWNNETIFKGTLKELLEFHESDDE
jgi:hypothetical protein